MNYDRSFILITFLLVIYQIMFKKENMSNTDVKKLIEENYKIDVNSIRNLSKLANDLTNNGKLVVPGGLEVKGGLTVSEHINSLKNINLKGDMIFNGKNNWILHTPDDNRHSLYIAPSKNLNNQSWDWNKGIELKGGNISTNGNGRFGNAMIGSWVGSNQYAALSHKDRFNTAKDYSLLNHKDGSTYVNGGNSKGLYLRINNQDSIKIDSNKNVSIEKNLNVNGFKTCKARFIEFYIQPNTGYGAVSEIEVYDIFGRKINIAKNKVSVRSNDWWDKFRNSTHWSPQNIVDGDKRNDSGAKGWHPRQGNQNKSDLIRIDLGSLKVISHIIIYNRWSDSQDVMLDNSILYVKDNNNRNVRVMNTGKWHRQYSKEFYL